MSSYSELIKNFDRIRAYMREFYVYGFKSRDGYNQKSARSYDDERRRMESILGDHMSFVRTPEGKNVFISINSRTSLRNPFYKAWKSKSFTDGDITLHFIIFDILCSPEVALSLPEIMRTIDEDYLSDDVRRINSAQKAQGILRRGHRDCGKIGQAYALPPRGGI